MQKRKGLQDRELERGQETFGGVASQRLAIVPWPPARLHMTFRLKTFESSQMSFPYTLGWSERDYKARVIIHPLPRFRFSMTSWKIVVLRTVPGGFQCLPLEVSMVLAALDNVIFNPLNNPQNEVTEA